MHEKVQVCIERLDSGTPRYWDAQFQGSVTHNGTVYPFDNKNGWYNIDWPDIEEPLANILSRAIEAAAKRAFHSHKWKATYDIDI
jgi:hypothetical protein